MTELSNSLNIQLVKYIIKYLNTAVFKVLS